MKKPQERMKKYLHVVMAVTTTLFLGAQPGLSQQVTPVDSQTEAPSSSKNQFKAPEPQETEEGASTNTWLIAGGVAALAVGAVALGSSGGSSSGTSVAAPEETAASDQSSSSSSSDSSSSTTSPSVSDTSAASSSTSTDSTATVTEFVGPNIAGGDWHGTLIIENEGFEGTQAVTASVVQSGASITLRTSSTLAYGKLFQGKISNNGYITVKDAQTQKIWTTYEGFATSSYIKIYDFVNGNSAFDRLVLSR